MVKRGGIRDTKSGAVSVGFRFAGAPLGNATPGGRQTALFMGGHGDRLFNMPGSRRREQSVFLRAELHTHLCHDPGGGHGGRRCNLMGQAECKPVWHARLAEEL